jgi:hypothetical protein
VNKEAGKMGDDVNDILRGHSERIAALDARQENVESMLMEIRSDIKEMKARPLKRLDTFSAALLGAAGGIVAKLIMDVAAKVMGG